MWTTLRRSAERSYDGVDTPAAINDSVEAEIAEAEAEASSITPEL
jgi:hypothetical protein